MAVLLTLRAARNVPLVYHVKRESVPLESMENCPRDAVFAPYIFKVQAGVVPMPTRPVESMRILSPPLVAK